LNTDQQLQQMMLHLEKSKKAFEENSRLVAELQAKMRAQPPHQDQQKPVDQRWQRAASAPAATSGSATSSGVLLGVATTLPIIPASPGPMTVDASTVDGTSTALDLAAIQAQLALDIADQTLTAAADALAE
jgi:hypothetical protein